MTKSKIRKTEANVDIMEIPLEDNVSGIHPSVNEIIPLVEEDAVDIETTEIGDQLFRNKESTDGNNILVGRMDEIECINQEDDADTSTAPEQLKLKEYSDLHDKTIKQEIQER